MIPRFNYSYTLEDAWRNLARSIRGLQPATDYLSLLFPSSAAYFVSSARTGIYYALRTFDLKAGARIGIQPYTCSSVLSAIVAAGHIPVFIDINQGLSIDIDDLRRKLPDLDALIVTHTLGIPADIHEIKQFSGRLPIIEDGAHAFLCQYKGKPVGTFFDAAVFSFGDGKFPSYGGGGLLLINTPDYNAATTKLLSDLAQPGVLPEWILIGKRLLRSVIHSRTGSALLERVLNKSVVDQRNKRALSYPTVDTLPLKSVPYSLQSQFNRLAERAFKQHENARYLYETNGADYRMLFDPDAGNAFAVALLDTSRNALYTHLRSQGIGAGKHFQHANLWAMEFGYVPGECPNFEQLIDKVLTIPCHHKVVANDLKRISQCLTEYAKKNRPANEKNTG